MKDLCEIGGDSSLHWHYQLYITALLLIGISNTSPPSDKIWDYFISLLTSLTSSIPIKHLALVAFSSKLLPLVDVSTYSPVHVINDEIKTRLLSSEFRKAICNSLIHDHEFYKSSGGANNSWSSSVREVITAIYPIRVYYASYIVSNSRAKRCSTQLRAWHVGKF